MSWQVLPFNVTRFDDEMFALCRAVPYLDHLLCWIEDAHFPILEEDRVLRNFHAELARAGSFEIRLPGTGMALRSERSVMLEDKTTFFSVQGRPDLVLAASRVGFGQPLTSVLLPAQRVVVNIHGEHWNVGATQAARAVALLNAHPPGTASPLPLLVTGDVNYAHHLWNQLGGLDAVLAHERPTEVAVTHQPIAPLAEIFADRPWLRVRPLAAGKLPRLDPRRVLPFPAGGKVVVAAVRDRILRIAEQRRPDAAQCFLAETEGLRRIWLTVRVDSRSALNLLDALTAICESLLTEGGFAVVLDGYSRPDDYAANEDYDKMLVERSIAHERAFADMLCRTLVARIGAPVLQRVHVGIGCNLLESVYLASHCHAYFAHHGTLQHKIGYFTRVPGMVHANPGILATDRAATHRHVMQEPGVIEYIDSSAVDAVLAPGCQDTLDHANSYRFNDIPLLVSKVRAFIARHVASDRFGCTRSA